MTDPNVPAAPDQAMTDEAIRTAVAQAVTKAYRDWAWQHPNLSEAIDRTGVIGTASQSLRQSPQFAEAVSAYHRARCELDLVAELVELARPILAAMLCT